MAKHGFGLYWEAVLQRILALIRCLLLNTSDNDPNDFPSSKFHFWIILKWSKMLWRQFRCLLLNTSENDPNDSSSSKFHFWILFKWSKCNDDSLDVYFWTLLKLIQMTFRHLKLLLRTDQSENRMEIWEVKQDPKWLQVI